MCGIAGGVFPSLEDGRKRAVLTAMGGSLRHRGPDDSDIHLDPDLHVGMVHRRLAILDLSPDARQPMVSADSEGVLCFNGEIYNFRELRKDLEGAYPFRGKGDTEVLLAACRRWGVPATLSRLNGMFAFAYLDRAGRRLHLARDPLGEKPLYWARAGDAFLFGSELKSLMAFPSFRGELRPGCARELAALNCIPAPATVFRNAWKLEPGSCLALDLDRAGSEPEVRRYYDAARVYAEAETSESHPDGLIEELDGLLRDSVRLRMVSDVPLGAFLSGGIDSSLICAIAQRVSGEPLRTFSVGFDDPELNEAPAARLVADYLGTRHTEAILSPDDLWRTIPEIPRIWCEPFADASQVPTLLISRVARKHVTVCLSGDGGDELFGGYNRYRKSLALWAAIRRLPAPFRAIGAASLERFPTVARAALVHAAGALGLGRTTAAMSAENLPALLKARGFRDFYWTLLTRRNALEYCAPEAGTGDLAAPGSSVDLPDAMRHMNAVDLVGYLPEDILVKVDRAAMSVGLEGRIPLLDPRIVAFSARVPSRMKLHESKGKWLLRRLLYRYVPEGLVDRPKQGFQPPIHSWLRGPLRDWSEELLAAGSLSSGGLWRVAKVRKAWEEHLQGVADRSWELWPVLMLEAWKREWGGNPGGD